LWNIAVPRAVHAYIRNRVGDYQFVEIIFAVENRSNLDAHRQVVDLQKRALAGLFRAKNSNVKKMNGQSSKAEIESADLSFSASCLVCRLRDLTNGDLLEPVRFKKNVTRDTRDHNQDYGHRQRPAYDVSPLHFFS
jgi:hypothetical protein